MAKEILERKDIEKEYTWDLESMYDGLESWNKDFDRCVKLGDEFHKHKDVFSKTSQGLLQA